MPIVQYSKRAPRAESGLPELGRIYKGAPRQSADQKQIPADLDYFRFEPSSDLPTAPAEELKAAWNAIYGEKPRVLRDVQFDVDSMAHAFSDWMEEWGMSNKGMPLLNKKCDGQTLYFERCREKQPDGKFKDVVYRNPVPCPRECDCKPTGRLRLFLPVFCNEVGVLGVVTLITHGTTDLDNIRNTLTMTLEKLGRLRNTAFVLHRVQEQLMTPDGFPVKKWIIHLGLENRGAQAVAQLAAQSALALTDGKTPPQPAAPALPARVPSVPTPKPTDRIEDAQIDEDGVVQPSERLLGVARHIVVKIGPKGRSYALKLESGPSVSLYGFDGIRALGDEWSAQADLWKEYEAGQHPISPLCVYSSSSGLHFAETEIMSPASPDFPTDIPF